MRIGFANAGFVQGSDEFGVRLSVYLLVNVSKCELLGVYLGEFHDFEFGTFPCLTLKYITNILWENVSTWNGVIIFSNFAEAL